MGNELTDLVENRIFENYCSGVYIPYEQVIRLYDEYNNNREVKEILNGFYLDGKINVFIEALQYCLENKLGLLEAAEVIEPNPLDLKDSICYSNILNCDKEGLILYNQKAIEEIKEMEKKRNLEPGTILNSVKYKKIDPIVKEKTKQSFWTKLFGK